MDETQRHETTVPSAARIYDYLLGGKDNYAVDRDAADRLLAVVPDQRILARANRAFVIRAMRVLAEQGARQVLDVGTGIPTSPSIHEVFHAVDRSARIVYVDSDPLVKVHNDALLATTDQVTSIEGDVRRPDEILDHVRSRGLLDLSEPVVVVLAAVLHLVPDAQDPAGIVARYRDAMAPGGHLVLSQFAAHSDPAAMARLHAIADGTPVQTYFRPREQILTFFDGFELLAPGLVDVERWRPGMDAPATRLKITGGVAQKSRTPGSAGSGRSATRRQ
ncbi:SAM-dependent methyltransferase [Actinomadura montaniterrae]|uniref:SAM-dependent methyltransferase n=1 Tax=Actinomadura montaniterrae TaxID=1803903 RepID=A0A6L3VIL7_9ACTN|nr:SAM-dependent methyltransferase [Actinomadura montaniterrae]KAB2366461.1 SAM-dependent methyltransferase [Actinomadura montaniterrae]